ncbi:MAG: SDR family oxidoreductase [Alphaproteobacteria bacterium]|nr:SDR family oxidoreductase [Alphaproteobacteria bacterium]
MPSVFITGANRGLGLEFARQYAEAGWQVLAACRAPAAAKALAAIADRSAGRVTLHPLEVSRFEQIDTLASALRGQPIDVLINNAGIGWPPRPPNDGFGRTDYEEWTTVMRVNVLAPMKLCEALVENVAASQHKVVAMISSRLGSIELAASTGNDHVYRSSKAALNMVTKMLAGYLDGRAIVPVALGPGWVRTDMGGSTAALSPEESVSGMRRVIAKLERTDAGGFFTYQGDRLPW